MHPPACWQILKLAWQRLHRVLPKWKFLPSSWLVAKAPLFVLQLVYAKEGVAAVVARKERIMGRLSLIKQNDVIFLAWLPNSGGSMLPDGTFHTSPLTGHPAASITGDPAN